MSFLTHGLKTNLTFLVLHFLNFILLNNASVLKIRILMENAIFLNVILGTSSYNS